MSEPNITHDSPTRGAAKPLPYLISAVLLALTIIAPLLVPLYAHDGPRLFSFPFFYWYQMAWVPVCALLVWISYKLLTAEDKRRRAAVRPILSQPNSEQPSSEQPNEGHHDVGGEEL